MRILEKDLYIISKIAFDNNYPVFVLDPSGAVIKNYDSGFVYIRKRNEVEQLAKYNKSYYLINISGASTFTFPILFDKVAAIISFSNGTETSLDFYHKDLYFFNDSNKKIKWLLSENHTLADFLHDLDENKSLVDVSNFLSVFPFAWKYLMIKLGNIKKISHGRIQILLRERYLFKTLDKQEFDSYSINMQFCGDGNIIFRLNKKGKTNIIIKKSWNEQGKRRIVNEIEKISFLKEKYPEYLLLPEIIKKNYESAMIFNTPFSQLEYYQLQKKWNPVLNDTLIDIAIKTLSESSIARILNAENVHNNLLFLKSRIDKKMFPNGLGIINFIKTFTFLVKIYDQLEPKEIIKTSFYLKNIAPQFIGGASKKLFFHNFEEAETSYPLYFDLLFFSFSYSESFEYPDTELLIKEIDFIAEFSIEKFNKKQIDFDFIKTLKIFMLTYFIPYMASLLVKQIVTPEENLKIMLWSEFLEQYNLGL